MKIFTLLTQLLKNLTGFKRRNLSFHTDDAKSVRPNAQRSTPNAADVQIMNASVQNPAAPSNDAFVSVEYKILPVQKKITSVQNIKPVFMQNFFAIVKKIFSLSDHPRTLLENLNEGYHPGCHYGTAGRENISRTNQLHDVANPAASFALIPIALTPTAMNHLDQKPVKKTITGRSGMFGIIMLMSSLFFVCNTFGQSPITFTANGTFIPPAGVTSVTVQAWGGGGGGGSRTSNGTAGGGAGGAFASSVVTVVPGTSYSIVVGTGGATNTAGLNSTFNGTTVVAAGGGGGAANATTAGSAALATASTGTTINVGGNGAAGSTFSGGGGGGAGTTNPGGNAPTATVAGFGTGGATGGGNGGTGVNGNSGGNNGTAPGGGGSGGSRTSFGTQNGGSGARGQVIISWNCPTYDLLSTTATSFCGTGTSTVTITSGTLTNGTYRVTYGTTNPTTSGNTANVTITGGTGSFSTISLSASSVLTITAISSGTAPAICTSAISANNTANITVNPLPTISLSGNPAVCSGATTANLNYSGTTNSPDQYSISWSGPAQTAGFVNVVNQLLPASPILITVPGVLATGTYSGTLTVTNSSTGCVSTGTAISVIVGAGGSWLGTTSTDWFDGTNWCGGVPTSASDVTIPAGTPNQPTIGGAGAVCNNITIASGATLTITGTNNLTVSGNWTKAGTLVPNNSTVIFNSAGTQTVANGGTGNFFAVTVGGAGTLQVLTNTFITSNSFNIAAGGTLDLGGVANPTLGDLQGNGFITNSNAAAVTLTEGNDNTSTTYSGIIQTSTGAIALTKTGTGALALSGANTYTGNTTLTSGTLNINNVSAIGAGTFIINGGTIDNTSGGAITLSTNNAITIGASFAFGGTNNLNLGTGAITNGGSRTITLNGTNSILTLGGIMTNTSGGNQTTTVNGAGNTFVLGGYTLANSGTSRNGTFTGSGNVIISGVVSNGSTATASSLTYSGTGALTLSGANTYGGTTTLSSGQLNINNLTALGTGSFAINGGTIDNTSGSDLTLTTNNTITFGGNFTFGGTSNLTFGTGAITNAGNRTITLNGAGTILTFGGVMTNSVGGNQTTTVNGTGNNLVIGGYALANSATNRADVVNGSGNVAINGAITNGSTSTASSIAYSGTGMLTLNGSNTHGGGTIINSGTLNINTATALGSGAFTIAGGTIDNTSGSPLTLTSNNAQNWNGDFTFTGTNALNLGTGNVTIAAARQATINANTLTDGGNFSGAGGITKAGPGLLILTGNLNNTGATTISAGELRLNPAANSTSASQVVLNGGILGTTGITATRTITSSSTLNLTANSSINLDPTNAHTITFAASNGVAWTPGALLTVNGWQGVAGASGTVGKIFFGSSLGTLTAAQLAQITFTGFPGTPIILVGTGEIVPQGAAPQLFVTGTLNNGNSCIGTAAATQTYTITNSGAGNADDITISSSDPQFAVSAPSATTVNANNGTVTFTVTFTATASGAQSSTITINSSTPGANTPLMVTVTGTGLALPVTTFTYNPGDPLTTPGFCQAAITNPSPTNPFPSPTFTGGGVAGTFSASPAGLVFISTSTGQVDLKNSSPGTYTVTNSVTGGNGCTASSTAQIRINALPIATISYAQPAYCTTDASVEPVIVNAPIAILSPSYSTIPASGLSINSSGGITPSLSTPGNYKVIITFISSQNLCPNTDTAFVTIVQTATGTISYPGSPYCTNSGIISVTNNLVGTTTGAQFTASPAGLVIDPNTGAVNPLTSTTGIPYTVTVTVPSLGGCSSYSTTAPISISDTPVATVSYVGSPFCTNGGTATPVITGATGGTYSSTPAGLTIDPSTGIITLASSTAGNYTITYQTPLVNGCTGSPKTSVTITATTTTPVLGTTTICTNTFLLTITLTGEANGTPIQVRENGVTVATLARTTSTTYILTGVTLHNGDIITLTAQASGKCLSNVSNAVTVGPPAQPGAITGSTSVCPSTSGNAYSVTAVPGATSYTWTYSGAGATFTGGTTATPTIAFSAAATSGTLSVTANNTCGSSAAQTLAITINPGIPAAAGPITGPASVCAGSSQTYSIASVTNATNYTWTVPTGWTINTGQGTISINVTTGNTGQNGNITVVPSNSCGSASAATTTVGPVDAGAGANLTGVGTTAWTNPGQITSPGDANFATLNLPAGGTTNYLRSSGYGFNIPSNATVTGITVVMNRDNSGSSSINDNTVKLVNASSTITGTNFAGGAAQNWNNGSLATNTFGGPTNNWSAGLTAADINSPNFGVVVAATSGSGSTRTLNVDYIKVSVTYTVPPLAVTVTAGPTITLGANPSVLCNGGTSASLPFTGTTGSPDQYSITYDPTAIGAGFANVTNAPLGSSPISLTIPTPLAGGVYNGTITVNNTVSGCSGSPVAFTITVPDALTTGTSHTDNTCFGGTTGAASVSPSGGNGSYTVSWTGPNSFTGSGNSITGLAAGTYNYSITDGNGCGPLTGSVIVGQAAQITTSTSETDASCFGNSDGAASVTPAGGNGTYTVTWTTSDGTIPSGHQNDLSLTGLTAGTYHYSILDGNGCGPLTGNIVVGQPADLIATPIITSACFQGNGTIKINTSGGSGNEFFLLPLNGGPTITPNTDPISIAAGDYQYLIIDGGCSKELDFSVGQSAQIVVAGDGSKNDVSCNAGTNGSITLGTVTGGTTPYAYTWTTSDGTIPAGQEHNANLTGLTAGTYNYSVTDANNCTAATGSVTITQPDAIAVANNGTKTDVSCNTGTNGSITLGTVTGGTTPYAYTWTTSDGIIPAGQEHVANPTGLTAGTYNFSVTDVNNCTAATGSFTITQPDAIAVANNGSKTDELCNAGTSGSITLGTVTGGTTPYTYTWTTSDGIIPAGQEHVANPSGLTAGTYNFSVTDANNCTAATGSFTINQPAAIVVANDGSKTDELCNGGTSGSITLGTVSGGTTPYAYTWTTSDGTIPAGQEHNANLSGLTAGTYNFSVTDANNCTAATGSFTINQPAAIVVAGDGSKTDVACNGGNTGSITLGTVSGGTTPYAYTWTTSDGIIPAGQEHNANLTGLTAGTYNYSVTDANNCTAATGSVTINQSAAIAVANDGTKTDVSCNAGTNGSITLGTVTGGTTPYAYTWTTSDGTIPAGQEHVANPTGLTAGTYNYSVTDVSGCAAATGSVTITQPDVIAVANNGTKTDVSCNAGTNGSITLGTVTGGTTPYAYTWTTSDGIIPAGQEHVANPTGLTAGTYNFSVTDANNCTAATGSFTITQPDAIAVANNGNKTDELCNAGTSGSITLGTVTGGTTPYAYTWTTSDGIIPAGQEHVANPTGLTAGTYNFSVTDANNCTAATGSFTINQPAAIVVANNGSKTDELCNGGTSGSITLGTVSGGTTPYAYTWTTSDGTIPAGQEHNANLSGLTAGTYNFSVTDANNCTAATGSFTINQPTAIVVAGDGSKTDVACNGGNTGSITLGTVSGGTTPYAYTWTTSDGIIPAGQEHNANLTGLTAGTYNYSVTDANNCTAATGSVTINQSAAIAVANDGTKTDVSCNAGTNGSITLGTVTGGTTPYAYTWTTSDGIIPAGQEHVANPTGLTAGTYNYSVTDVSGCAAATGSFTINQPDAIAVAGNGTDINVSCNGGHDGSITLGTVTGGTTPYAYTWTTSDGIIPAGQEHVANPAGLTAGTYNFSVTDVHSCSTATGSFTITQPDAIAVVGGSKTDELCNGGTNGSITLGTVTGGTTPYAYTWTTSDGIIPAGQEHVANPSGLTAGTYNFSVTDKNNCTAATGSFTINQPDAIAVVGGSKTDVSCNGGTNGSLTLGTVTGGTTPYAYTWTTSDGTIPAGQEHNANLTGLTAGTYHYSVTDLHNCTAATGSVTITQPNAIVVAGNGSKTDVACNGGNTGSITLGTVSGGTTPYAYTWTTSDGIIPAGQEHNANLTGLTAGTYHYSVTDVNNCTAATGSITINQSAAIIVANNGSKTDVSCNGGNNGSITLGTVSGGTTPYVYTWTTSDGIIPAGQEHNANLNGLKAGTYNYSVTDAHTCTAATGSITINQPNAIVVGLSSKTDVLCNGGTTGSITLGIVTGGTTPYAYTWTTSDGIIPAGQQNNANLNGLKAGTYNYSVTDVHGCAAATGSVTINQPPVLAAIASAGTVSCNNGTTQLFVIATGGSGSYTYSLNGGTPQLGFVFTVGAGGPYTVTVSDGNCSVTTTPLSIANPTQMIIGITSITPSGCGGATGSFNVLASGGAGSYTYSLNGGTYQASGLFTGLAANSYLVTAKDANGCTAPGIVTIPTATPPMSFTVTSGPDNCTGLGVHIGLGASQLGVNYQLYLNGAIDGPVAPIAGGNGSPIDFGPQPSGTYTVVATSTAGCIANMTGSVTVNSSSLPIPYNVTGGGSYCSGGLGLHVGLQNSETGVNYQVFNGATVASGIFAGSTGSQIDFGLFQAGTYTVKATNAGGCTSTMPGSATISLTPTPATFSLFAPNGLNDCTGTGVDIKLSGSENTVSYQLYMNGIAFGSLIPGTGSQIDLGNKPSGTYTIVGTSNTGGCIGNMSNGITVNSSSAPTPYLVTGGGNFCSGTGLPVGLANSETGVNYVLVLNGITNVGFATGTTGHSITFGNQTANGSYTVTATNTVTNCTSQMSGSVSITAGTPPTVTVNSPSRCAGGAGVTITATPALAGTYTYVWSVPGGVSDPGNVASFTATVAGIYSVTITNTIGCSGTGSGTLTVNPAPTVTVNSPSSCSGIAATITATPSPAGSYTYAWTVPGGASNPGNVASFTSAIAGTYSVTITNGNGCTGSGSGILSLNTPPTVTVSTPARCSNGAASTITANPSPAGTYTYVWTVPAGVSNPGNVASFTSTIAGAYSVTITNTGGCTANGTSTLIVNPAPTVTVNSPTRNSGGPAATIIATPSPAGSYSYAWTVPGGVINPGSVASFSATVAGTYSVTITNGNGCTGNGSGVLTVVNATAPTVTVNSASRCANGPGVTITATPSPAGTYTYVWTVPSGANNPGNVASFTATVAGTYKVTITNASAQTATGSGVLTVNPSVTIVIQPVSTQTCAGGTESFSVVATGATGYQWYRNSNLIIGATNAQYSTGIAARYDVRVFDACGGSVMSNFAFLTINGPVAITSQPQSQTICSEGTATFTVGTINANGFQWYRNNTAIPGAVNTSYTTGTAGNYKVVVSGGCGGPITSNVATLSFLPPPPVAGVNGTGTICAGTTVRFTDATSGGTWSSSNTSVATVSAIGNVRGVSPGTATIRYTISNGCSTNSATRNITVNGVPNVQNITGSPSVCPGSTILLSDGTPNGDWSSSNTSIATVNNNGRVRGIRNGNVTISYTVQNNCGSKTVSFPIAVSCSSIQKNSLGTTTNSADELTLNVSVSPNPSQNFFTLIAQSSVLDAPITISIFDMQSRLVDKHTAGVGEAVRFGDRFAAGMYIVQVTQGGLQKTVKVVKN